MFKLDHDLGFGYAEYYDFTDIRVFDGRFVFIYNLIDSKPAKQLDLNRLTASGIALGPIALYKEINTRGKWAWKKLGKTNTYLLENWPVTKDLRGHPFKTWNWNDLDKWYIRSDDHDPLEYVPYEKVRRYETLALMSHPGVATEFSMKRLIDLGKKVNDYYNLNEFGNQIKFVQLINTYYPLETASELIKELPPPYGD